ncbi:MAG: hypothetical protein L0271_06580 [Gemmatimonadetes bacterium]|nr:hypothetical protein [Gemmatimonadota bacterium]
MRALTDAQTLRAHRRRTHQRTPLWSAGAIAAALLIAPAPAAAQAVCSAPHSSPTLTRAGIGTMAQGQGWVQVSLYHSRSDEFYDITGNARPFLANGEARTSSVYVTGAIGVVRGIEVLLQLPVHRLVFEDVTGTRERIGIGDPRISARFGTDLVGRPEIPVTVRTSVKLPGSDFPVDPNLLPLTEGQADLEVSVESGHAIAGPALHVVGWLGYRWRFEDAERNRKPGNERFARLGLGGSVRALRWEMAAEALSGQPLEQQGLALETAKRRLVQLAPTIGWNVGSAQLEVSGRINLSGRNLPTGPSFLAGVLIPFSLSQPKPLFEQ